MTIPFGLPIIGDQERAAVLEALSSPILVHGPRAAAFEAAFAAWTGAPHAVSVSSCTAGMHLVWFGLGLGPGDEVIAPAQTHVATAHAVELTGARTVFVDAERETGNLDLNALEAAITERTRAIVVVHFLGMPVDMTRVMEIARRRGLFVLEDCALAAGSRLDGVHAGLLGDAGVFSFYPVKHITTAEGGMVITRDGALAARLRLQRAFGIDRSHGERAAPGDYDAVALGFNYRMNELEAALGQVQLGRLDGFLDQRRRNHAALTQALSGLPGVWRFRSEGGRFQSSHYCLSIVLEPALRDQRAAIIARMKAAGVGSSVYYPKPVPAMTYYVNRYGAIGDRFPVASWISACSIALPVGPHLNEADMQTIAAAFTSALTEARS